MELHTLGVNGGYTQKDVTEVARVFTGWTLKQPREGGGFFFDERQHEPGKKWCSAIALNPPAKTRVVKCCTSWRTIRRPRNLFAPNWPHASFLTIRHRRWSTTWRKTFLKKDGDIREVLKTMLQSPEFWAPEAYRAKVKTPLEFVVSAARASGADVADAAPLARQLQNMGMQLYGAQPPTGYSTKSEAWVNSSALLDRMNFALALTAGKLKGTR